MRILQRLFLTTILYSSGNAMWKPSTHIAFLRGGSTSTSSCCYIPSQSVPNQLRETVYQQLVAKIPHLQYPKTYRETAANTDVVIFRPDAMDLQRTEGLWELLGPVMEHLLISKQTASLCIISELEESYVRETLEQASLKLIRYLSHAPDGHRTISDVFDAIRVVQNTQQAVDVVNEYSKSSTTAVAQVSKTTTTLSPISSIPPPVAMTPANLAAARRLGVEARRQVDETLETVRRATIADDGRMKLVMNFGDLCRASIRALDSNNNNNNPVALQMQSYVKNTLLHSMLDLYDQQMILLEQAVFQEFRKNLSNLKITPNLPSDMNRMAETAVQKFAQSARRMGVPGANAPTNAFRRKLTSYIQERLLKAQATNKFRPLPRKGITVGFHWLLPKPFGNDYRQEPWKVHAADHMVYVPGALADVNPEQVADGTWRDAIVPLPSGRDMLYMQ